VRTRGHASGLRADPAVAHRRVASTPQGCIRAWLQRHGDLPAGASVRREGLCGAPPTGAHAEIRPTPPSIPAGAAVGGAGHTCQARAAATRAAAARTPGSSAADRSVRRSDKLARSSSPASAKCNRPRRLRRPGYPRPYRRWAKPAGPSDQPGSRSFLRSRQRAGRQLSWSPAVGAQQPS